MSRRVPLFGRMRRDWEAMYRVCRAADELMRVVDLRLGEDAIASRWQGLRDSVERMRIAPDKPSGHASPARDPHGIVLFVPKT